MQLAGSKVLSVRHRLALLPALAIALALAACSIGPPPPKLAVRDDKFLPYRQFTTGRQVLVDIAGTRATELIARRDRTTGAVTTLLDVEISYTSDHMASFNEARNARAMRLPLTSAYRNRRCSKGTCDYSERFSVTIPSEELRAAGGGGYALKIFARQGATSTIVIEKAHIDQLLAAVSRDREA